MRIIARLHSLVLLLVLTLVPVIGLTAGERHTGHVLNVGTDSLVVDEFGRAGREQKLQITVTPNTRITDSQRNPHATSPQDLFRENTISLNEVKKGDVVTVETTSEGKKLVADSITVTLRGGAQ